jgi:DNA-binding transcriptional MocR family regulator
MASRPTLASLAEQLGLSRQTVSNAINAPERVKPDTLRRVNEMIVTTGYRPNAAASSFAPAVPKPGLPPHAHGGRYQWRDSGPVPPLAD